jgi:hypothetical protein
MQEQRHYPQLWIVALDRNPENAGHLGNRPNLRAFCASCADAFQFDLKQKPHQERDPDAPRSSGRRPAPVQQSLDL